jgi:hypothetical protein
MRNMIREGMVPTAVYDSQFEFNYRAAARTFGINFLMQFSSCDEQSIRRICFALEEEQKKLKIPFPLVVSLSIIRWRVHGDGKIMQTKQSLDETFHLARMITQSVAFSPKTTFLIYYHAPRDLPQTVVALHHIGHISLRKAECRMDIQMKAKTRLDRRGRWFYDS